MAKNPIDVEMVHDNVTKKNWIIHADDQGNYYYLKNNNGDHSTMSIDAKTNTVLGGHFEKFETANARQARLTNDIVDKMSGGFAGISFGLTALPFMAATGGGGSLLAYSVPETIGIGAAKFTAGAVSDFAVQLTLNGSASNVNYWEVGLSGVASTVGLNAYTGAALSSLVQDVNNTPTLPGQAGYDYTAFGLNTATGGLIGAASGAVKPFADLGPIKDAGLRNNGVQTIVSTIVGYWQGTASGAAAGVTSEQLKEKNDTNK